MSSRFIIDKKPSISTAMEVPAFPWLRSDAGRFIWEEALYEGNYLSVHGSAMGRCQSKENIHQKLSRHRFPQEHLFAFELEVDGQLLRDHWQWEREQISRTPEGFDKLEVELSHQHIPIAVRVHTLLDGTEFLVRWLDIVNRSERPVALSRVFPWCGLIASEEEGTAIVRRDSDRGFSLGRYRDFCWGMEGEWFWSPLPEGTFSVRTLGNKHNPPLFIVKNESTGEMTVLHVECTPNIEVSFTHGFEAGFGPARPWWGRYVYAKAGLGGKPPHRILEPGESASTPPVHTAMVYGDLDACVNALHDHLRTSVAPAPPPGGANLVEYNHTGYTLNAQVSKELLRQEVDVAAEIGVELFLVDAGWFGPKEKAWYQSVGDWFENPILGEGGLRGCTTRTLGAGKGLKPLVPRSQSERPKRPTFPRCAGLREVLDYARAKGMKCGLWMPPEWVSRESKFFQGHSDWFIPGTTTFDLLKPAVQKHLYDAICSAIEEFGLDCYRIDGGASDVGERTLADGRVENLSWRYYEKLYGIYERVRQRFPHLIMENCCGGGGRCDLAMLRRFHYTQITDNWDPPCQIRILNGMTIGLAPEQCMPLVGSINMRVADIDFVIRSGLLGHFTASGVFPHLERVNAPTLERWKHAIALYKSEIRPMLSSCRVYHHTPEQDYRMCGEWVVLEYARKDAAGAVAGLFRLAGSVSDTYRLVPRGLDVSRDYLVTFDNSGHTAKLPGAQLCTSGVPVRIAAPLMSELLIIKSF